MIMKTRRPKTYWVQQKQFYEGSIWQYNPTSRTKTSQINNLTLHLKQLEREEQKKTPKVSRRKEIISLRSEINEKE